jgi:plasmid segregation protein ParM
VKEAFATHQILEVKDPMFANVRGYQIAGTNYAYTALQAAGRTLRSMQTEGGDA